MRLAHDLRRASMTLLPRRAAPVRVPAFKQPDAEFVFELLERLLTPGCAACSTRAAV
jgi:hypothetical protein